METWSQWELGRDMILGAYLQRRRWGYLWSLLATDRSRTCTSLRCPRYFLAVSGTKQRPTGESRWEGWAVLRMVCHLDSIFSKASFTDLWNLSPVPQPIKNGLSEVRASDLYPFISRFIPDGWRWCSFWGVRLVDSLIFPDDNFCKKTTGGPRLMQAVFLLRCIMKIKLCTYYLHTTMHAMTALCGLC